MCVPALFALRLVLAAEPAPAAEDGAAEESAVDPNETPEEAAARLLVERIAREVDEELKK